MKVALISFIREEMIFDGMEALAGQIAADAREAKRRLAARRSGRGRWRDWRG